MKEIHSNAQTRTKATRKRCWKNSVVQTICAVSLMILCAVVLSWTKNKLEIPTYWNRNQGALYFMDLFKDPPNVTTVLPTIPVTKVFIFAYDGGGSSLLGEAFYSNDDVFYWAEPSEAANSSITETKTGFNVKSAKNVEFIFSIFGCDIKESSLVINHLLVNGKWPRPQRLKHYKDCIPESVNGTTQVGDSATEAPRNPWMAPKLVDRCVEHLSEACDEADVRVVSSPRHRPDTVLRVLERYPGTKVVHLVRDPRGLLAARHGTTSGDQLHVEKLTGEAAELCDRMRHDQRELSRLRQLRKISFLQVKYEQLVKSPLQTTVRLYRFLGLEPPESVLDAMHKVTYTAREPRDQADKDSEVAMALNESMSWTEVLSDDIVDGINRRCKDIVELFDYPLK